MGSLRAVSRVLVVDDLLPAPVRLGSGDPDLSWWDRPGWYVLRSLGRPAVQVATVVCLRAVVEHLAERVRSAPTRPIRGTK